MIKIMNGNILNATEDVICQQVNCCGVMGAGLAKQIRNKYPTVYKEYKLLCNKFKWDNQELLGLKQIIKVSDDKFVVNLFGQRYYGRDKKYTVDEALQMSLESLRDFCESNKLTIAIPYNIGCGLAGGNWNIIYGIIENVFKNCDMVVTIYKFK